jgi:hypothetical protein
MQQILGNWTVVKQDKRNEKLNCLTIEVKSAQDGKKMQATYSFFNTR